MQSTDSESSSITNPDNPMVVSDGDTGLALLLCAEARGARMFGSYSCGHCVNQKKSFGDKALAEFDRIYEVLG